LLGGCQNDAAQLGPLALQLGRQRFHVVFPLGTHEVDRGVRLIKDDMRDAVLYVESKGRQCGFHRTIIRSADTITVRIWPAFANPVRPAFR
jgi:hypothetical protein